MAYLRNVLYRKPDTAGTVISLQGYKADKVQQEFDDAVKKLRAVGVILTKTGQKRGGRDEYKVNVVAGHESTAYYGEDLQDIIDTGYGLSAWPADNATDLSRIVAEIIEKASQ